MAALTNSYAIVLARRMELDAFLYLAAEDSMTIPSAVREPHTDISVALRIGSNMARRWCLVHQVNEIPPLSSWPSSVLRHLLHAVSPRPSKLLR